MDQIALTFDHISDTCSPQRRLHGLAKPNISDKTMRSQAAVLAVERGGARNSVLSKLRHSHKAPAQVRYPFQNESADSRDRGRPMMTCPRRAG